MIATRNRNFLIALTTLALAVAAIGDAAHARGQGGGGAGGANGDNGEAPIVLSDATPVASAAVPGGPDNHRRGAQPRIEGCRIDPGHDFDRGRAASQFCVR